MSRASIVVALILAAVWQVIGHYVWEFGRAILYERIWHVIEPHTSNTIPFLFQYGPTAALVLVGFVLWWDAKARPKFWEWPRKAQSPGVKALPSDWSLRELFSYLAPHLPLTASQKDGHSTIGAKDERWERIGDQVLKQLSLGRLHAVGEGYRNVTQRLQSAPIPAEFWRTAKFTYWFLDDDGKGILDVKNLDGIEYSSVEVDRNEALTIWAHPLASSLDRIPVCELLRMAAPLGWNFVSRESLHLIDLQEAIRQGGLDGVLTIWGRLNRYLLSETLMKQEPLDKIPSDHWREYRAHLFTTLSRDNFNTKTWRPTNTETAVGYIDLHVDRNEASAWLTRDAAAFMGKAKA
jgi:hypothetical protein